MLSPSKCIHANYNSNPASFLSVPRVSWNFSQAKVFDSLPSSAENTNAYIWTSYLYYPLSFHGVLPKHKYSCNSCLTLRWPQKHCIFLYRRLYYLPILQIFGFSYLYLLITWYRNVSRTRVPLTKTLPIITCLNLRYSNCVQCSTHSIYLY